MNNFVAAIKRFLGNKNTVTIIGVIAGILVLYIGYNWRLNTELKTTSIPYAKNTLNSRHKIKAEDLGYMDVPQTVLKKNNNIVRLAPLIVGQEVKYSTTIPANSFFYADMLVDSNEQPGSVLADIPAGYRAFTLNVDTSMTHVTSMIPGNYIDLYVSGIGDSGLGIYGKLIQSIKILAVQDTKENNVYESNDEERKPAKISFAVPDDMADLLEKAIRIPGGYNLKIIPVPRNASYTANPGATVVKTQQLKDFILSKYETIIEDNNE